MSSVPSESAEELRDKPIASLPEHHRRALIRAITNILSCEAAEVTFAQIVDGMPLSHVEKDSYDGTPCPIHPLHTKHRELCPGVLERTRQFRDDFDGSSLGFSPMILHDYETASPGSRIYMIRLIEMTALAIHQIAVQLFRWQETNGCHRGDELCRWIAPETYGRWWSRFPDGIAPTLLRHSWYCDYDRYPNGVADGVAFWAESRIFGGVVLFDRRQPGSVSVAQGPVPEVDLDAVYFHSCRKRVTYRIYKLLDSQKQDLVRFLTSDESPPSSCPLPILGTQENDQRFDPEESGEDTGIYREKWSRPPLAPGAFDRRARDVSDTLNWPGMTDLFDSQRRGFDRKYFLEYGVSRYEDRPEESE